MNTPREPAVQDTSNSPDVAVLDQHTGVVDRLSQTLLEHLRDRGKQIEMRRSEKGVVHSPLDAG